MDKKQYKIIINSQKRIGISKYSCVSRIMLGIDWDIRDNWTKEKKEKAKNWSPDKVEIETNEEAS